MAAARVVWAARPAAGAQRASGQGAPAPCPGPRRVSRASNALVAPGRRVCGRTRQRQTATAASRSSGDADPAAQPSQPAAKARRLSPLGDPELVEVLELADDKELHQLHNLLHGAERS